ncbi:Cytochrome P450 [Naviculisporaceae sp. PSN 640]
MEDFGSQVRARTLNGGILSGLAGSSSWFWITTLLVVALAVWIGTVLWRMQMHPLSKFPGPPLAAISNLPYSASYLGGRQPYDMLKLHEKYGPVVRVAPNELSFNTAQSWKDIYAHRKGHETFVKSAFYDGGNFADKAHSIVSERDPEAHSEMRRYLSSAFSDRSLREQEHLIAKNVDAFIDQVGRLGSASEGVDMTTWFNLMTFDIIGDLAFGMSFDGISSGKTHSWIAVVLESMGQASLSDTISRFPMLGKLYMRLNPGWLNKLLEGSAKHEQYTMDLIERRLNETTDRKDFMSYLVHATDDSGKPLSHVQLAAHASDFVIAGSETTATAMTVITYYLGRNPEMLKRLREEVRSTFKNYEEIDGNSAAQLRYLHALCLEALRIFPPLPLGLPRVVPAGGDTVDGHWIPGGTIVSTNPLAASLNPENFADPWRFDPERWLALDGPDVLEASQPFMIGPRVCLGRALAWLEMRTTLAKLHFRYDVEVLDTGVDWHRDAEMHLLWKKPALRVRVTKAGIPSPSTTMTSLNISEQDIPRLDGKVAIITGGASGIGLATAKLLASRGAVVHILDLYPPTRDNILPETMFYTRCDVSNWSALRDAFTKAGRVDIAVANAGVSQECDYFADTFDANNQLEEPSWAVVDINFRAVLNFTKLAMSAFRRQGPGGSLVITASATAYSPEYSLPAYSATKLGLIGLVRALRVQMPLLGATINAVAPAATITKLLPADLAKPIMAAGAPVSSAHHVALAIAYSAVATQARQVEGYGRDSEEKVNSPGRWNGRCILTLGDRWAELEEPTALLRQQWFGEYNTKMTAFQQKLTDTRPEYIVG